MMMMMMIMMIMIMIMIMMIKILMMMMIAHQQELPVDRRQWHESQHWVFHRPGAKRILGQMHPQIDFFGIFLSLHGMIPDTPAGVGERKEDCWFGSNFYPLVRILDMLLSRRVAKCHGYDGYICVKNIGWLGQKYGEHVIWLNEVYLLVNFRN